MEFKPHSYQAYCIQRIVQDPAIGLFLRPGLGKTVITLTAVNILRYYYWQISRVLVIAPKKVAEATWSKEAQKWEHLRHLKVQTVIGSTAKRIRALNTPADVYVINRENVQWLVDYYKQAWSFDMLVLDESTGFKNPTAKRVKALKLIRRFCKKVVLLTGTPVSRGIEDLWAQVYMLDEGQRLGKTISSFRDQYFTEKRGYRGAGQTYAKYEAQDGAEARVLAAISDICISMKAEDYLELPECIEHEIPVYLDEKSKRGYDEFERELLFEVEDDTITAMGAAALTGRLLEWCNGSVYDSEHKVIHLHDCKLDAFEELLSDIGGEPVMVFYWFKHDLLFLRERLAKFPLRVRELKGSQDEDDWNAGKIDVLLAQPASCAYGLNLQAGGRHVIWYGLNWNFELNDQGRCRLWRQGSEYDKVYVHYLVVQGCVDEDVMAAIRDRTDTHNAVMRALKARVDKLHKGGIGA